MVEAVHQPDQLAPRVAAGLEPVAVDQVGLGVIGALADHLFEARLHGLLAVNRQGSRLPDIQRLAVIALLELQRFIFRDL